MGYKLKVKLNSIKNAMDLVEDYKDNINCALEESNTIIGTNLKEYWQGEDYVAFQTEWDAANEKFNNKHKLINQIESYHTFLKRAHKEYDEMQSYLIEKSKNLQ